MKEAQARIRLDSLTGVRWWAAFAVFVFHYHNVGNIPGIGLGTIGYTGVAFFFVLSGFVLTWSASPKVTKPQFWMRRVARIWPAHFVALLLALPVFYPWDGPTATNWWEKDFALLPILAAVFLVQGFSTNPLVLFAGNPAAWTLSSEAAFYFTHPFANSFALKLKKAQYLIFVVAILALGILSVKYAGLTPTILNRFWEFFLGMFAAHLLKRGFRTGLPAWVGYLVTMCLVISYWLLHVRGFNPALEATLEPMRPFYLPIIYMLVIIILASSDLEGRRSLMRWKPMVIAGEISYAFYLVHATVLYLFLGWYGRSDSVLVFIFLLICAFLVAAALHYLVERPCEKRIRAWADKRFGPKTS
ncbi:acyltransferase family protein [Gleimia coleocanis]|nr:acyltransferase [Gleimia coleocanis]